MKWSHNLIPGFEVFMAVKILIVIFWFVIGLN
jgi:hypothetical protein